MSPSSPSSLSVVIAVQMAQQNLPDIIRALDCPRHPQVEFLVCYAENDPDVKGVPAQHHAIRVVPGAAGSLIPHLWRDGIRAARNDAVAITTAHCIPGGNWVACLERLDLRKMAGIGGVIENDPESDAKGWAIFLLRYIGYAPPQTARRVDEIAADNALYRRDLILSHPDLLDQGFWEPSFHARFRAAGLPLSMDPQLRVMHRNRYRPGQFFAQRFAHGKEFGMARAASLPVFKRLLLILLSPVLPLIFLRKIVKAASIEPQYRRQLPRALPWLLFFLLGWGLGEARGYMESAARK